MSPRLSLTSSPAVEAAQAWFAARSQREQLLLTVLAVLAAVAFAWWMVLSPLLSAQAAAKARIAAYESIQQRLKSGVRPSQQPVVTGDLTTILNTAASSSGLTLASVNGGTVTLTEAPYNGVVAWIAAVEASGVTISSVRMTPGASPGLVNVQLEATP